MFSIKDIEEKELRIIIKDPINENSEQQVSTAFVDDTDFTTDEDDCKQKMQEILINYIELYQVMSGKV